MTTSQGNPVYSSETSVSVDWRAIVAGTIAAAAVSLLLISFGSALGLSAVSARPYAGLSSTSMAIATAVWLAVVNIIAFVMGGYLTGRLHVPQAKATDEREFRDGAHGAIVWALGTLLGAYLLASAASGLVGKTAEVATKSVEGALNASTAIASGPLGEAVQYNVDRMLRSTTPTGSARPEAALTGRDMSEVARILGVGLINGSLVPADREYLAGLIAHKTGVTKEDAIRRVDENYTAVVQKKAELEAKARDAAESARKSTVLAAFLTAAVSLAGLVAAAWAARCGGRDRDEGTSHPVVLGQERLW